MVPFQITLHVYNRYTIYTLDEIKIEKFNNKQTFCDIRTFKQHTMFIFNETQNTRFRWKEDYYRFDISIEEVSKGWIFIA